VGTALFNKCAENKANSKTTNILIENVNAIVSLLKNEVFQGMLCYCKLKELTLYFKKNDIFYAEKKSIFDPTHFTIIVSSSQMPSCICYLISYCLL